MFYNRVFYIGIWVLCQSKDKTVVEYALSDIYKPIAVSQYQLTKSLPENLKSSLPSIQAIEDEFNKKVMKEMCEKGTNNGLVANCD